MAVSVLPVYALLFLGSTIDRRNFDYQIFYSDSVVNNTVAINSKLMRYQVLEDTFPYSFYGFPLDWSLLYKYHRITTLSFPFIDPAKLLQHTKWQKHQVTVVFQSLYRTVDVSLNEDEAVKQFWKTKKAKTQTHYVDTLRYGAYAGLIVNLQCDNIEDIPIVRKRVVSILGESGELTSDIKNKWEKVQEAVFNKTGLKGIVWTTSSWSSAGYAIFPEGGIIGQLDQMLNIDKMGTGNGRPLYMELKPLHDIDPSFPALKRNNYLEKRVAKMIQMVDDIQNTQQDLNTYYSELSSDNEQRDIELENLADIMEKVRINLSRAASKVNIFDYKEDPAITAAMQSYVDGLQEGAPSYFSTYLNILKKYGN